MPRRSRGLADCFRAVAECEAVGVVGGERHGCLIVSFRLLPIKSNC
jgi:hypothetical protein